jgi:colicin import membrane protein
MSQNGSKSYVKEGDLVGAKVIGKTKDGKTIYEGPRGGQYYYNSNGNKTYVKKQ